VNNWLSSPAAAIFVLPCRLHLPLSHASPLFAADTDIFAFIAAATPPLACRF